MPLVQLSAFARALVWSMLMFSSYGFALKGKLNDPQQSMRNLMCTHVILNGIPPYPVCSVLPQKWENIHFSFLWKKRCVSLPGGVKMWQSLISLLTHTPETVCDNTHGHFLFLGKPTSWNCLDRKKKIKTTGRCTPMSRVSLHSSLNQQICAAIHFHNSFVWRMASNGVLAALDLEKYLQIQNSHSY